MCTCPNRAHVLRDSLGRFRRHGAPRVHPRTAARRDYLLYLDSLYRAAEAATRGHLRSAEGRTRGVRADAYFSLRPPRSERWASEELRDWLATHRILTESEYLAQIGAVA